MTIERTTTGIASSTRCDQSRPQRLRRHIVIGVVAGLHRVVEHRSPIAGGLDCADQITDADVRIVFDVGPLNGEIHRRMDAVKVVEATFDPRRAG